MPSTLQIPVQEKKILVQQRQTTLPRPRDAPTRASEKILKNAQPASADCIERDERLILT